MAKKKPEGYVNMELEVDDHQKMIMDIIINEGRLREREEIVAYLCEQALEKKTSEEYRKALMEFFDYINQRTKDSLSGK